MGKGEECNGGGLFVRHVQGSHRKPIMHCSEVASRPEKCNTVSDFKPKTLGPNPGFGVQIRALGFQIRDLGVQIWDLTVQIQDLDSKSRIWLEIQ